MNPDPCSTSAPTIHHAPPAATPAAGATATGARPAPKSYQLRPASEIPLPPRALPKLRKLFRLRQQASDLYAKMDDLEKVLMPPNGSPGILRPGIVYRLPQILTIGQTARGPKRAGAIRFTDNFDGQIKASKNCTIKRYELDSWVHGPALAKEEEDAQP